MFIKRLCPLFACLVVLLAPHSSMGSDFPRRFAIESPSPDILTEVAIINDGLSAAQGIQFINWGSIQTNAPIDGVNIYEPFASNSWWAVFLDGLDTTDRGLVCTLEFLETPWAIERSTNTMVQNPLTGAQEPGLVRIYPAYTNTWQDFIKYLLEVTPQITHLQIDNEPENVWVHAPGYIEALNLAYDAVQEFNAENPGRDVVVLAAGFYLSQILTSEMSEELVQEIITNYPAKLELAVLQQYYPNIAEEVLRDWSQQLHLVVGVLSQEDPANPSFDILSLHHDKGKTYDRAGDLVAWYRNHMSTGIHGAYDRPIWLDDMASNYVPGNSTDEDITLLEQLENGDEATIAEFNRGQSSWLVKKAVGHFGAGFERVSIAYGQDAPDFFLPIWRYMGLFYTNNVPKPAYYTTQLMVENLDGFTSATRLQQADTNNYLYRFSFAAKPDVFVAWRENEGMMDLSEYTTGTTLRATHLVMETTPEGDAIWPPQEGVPAASVPVTPLPVFLVATDSPLDTYVVTYKVNGATSGTAPASQTKTNDVALTLQTNSGSLAKTGYTFAGWNTAANGSGTTYAAGGSYTANAAVTLYANWTANTSAVYRFWSNSLKAHFFTVSAGEKDNIIATWPDVWTYEGIAFYVYGQAVNGSLPVHRFWSDRIGCHLFTISDAEKATLQTRYPNVFTYEGYAWHAFNYQAPGTLPVYRFWAPNLKKPFFTISEAEKNNVIANMSDTWSYKGIAWYAYATSSAKSTSSITPQSKASTVNMSPSSISEVSQAGELPGAVTFSLSYGSDEVVSAMVYDPVEATFMPVLGPTLSPLELMIPPLPFGQRYWLSVMSHHAGEDKDSLDYGGWFGRVSELPEQEMATVAVAGEMVIGLPVEHIVFPETDDTLTMRLYSDNSLIQTSTGIKGGSTYELSVPAWNRWYRVDIVREQDGTVLESQWVGHIQTH